MTTPKAVQQALAGVVDPLLGQNLVDLGMVRQVRVGRGGRVVIRLTLPSHHWPAADAVLQAARAAVASLPGVAAVEVQTADEPAWSPYHLSPALKAPLGLPDLEPPAPYVPSAARHATLRRLLNR